ncbi:AraC family transcriptional regulator with amidase-like domain [Kribbella pratensis]|uniref:AraC family transcriptional regulator with amidase-like domain n=1 Tax=Kribbella pratensis TaxID=2512112 RepID=A0ABY2FCY9_9ACTN|nr:helix-turn-helix domain-containing protein [Kribbella pratensis]TDW88344.1 AraC family transcriptional regulator with amidase-like domain [Kribbella pratensis]
MSLSPHEPQIRTRRVAFVVYDGVTLLDVTGPVEVLHQANQVGSGQYETVLVSAAGGQVTAASGLVLAGTITPNEAGTVDTVVVAGADHLVDGVPSEVLNVTAALAANAPRVASVCSGAFVLAALGLLDGRRATTHWRHAAAMARQYPKVEVVPDALHITDGRYVTSAGISAGIDLTLALVEADHGADTARAVARELVVFMQRPGGQSQFSTAMATPPARTELMRTITDTVVADPAGDHTLPRLAATAAVSSRHLTRLFQNEFRTTPGRWVERVRLDRAQQLLLDGHSITTAARLSGLGSDETLRRAFARHLGATPTEYLRRFKTV